MAAARPEGVDVILSLGITTDPEVATKALELAENRDVNHACELILTGQVDMSTPPAQAPPVVGLPLEQPDRPEHFNLGRAECTKVTKFTGPKLWR